MRLNSLGAMVLMLGAGMGLTSVARAEPSWDDDPPRRRRQPMQTHVTLPAAEPEVLSKRAKRRQKGKAREAARLERENWHRPSRVTVVPREAD